jgi:hypothetical protein
VRASEFLQTSRHADRDTKHCNVAHADDVAPLGALLLANRILAGGSRETAEIHTLVDQSDEWAHFASVVLRHYIVGAILQRWRCWLGMGVGRDRPRSRRYVRPDVVIY